MYKYYDTLPGVTINKKNQQNESREIPIISYQHLLSPMNELIFYDPHENRKKCHHFI